MISDALQYWIKVCIYLQNIIVFLLYSEWLYIAKQWVWVKDETLLVFLNQPLVFGSLFREVYKLKFLCKDKETLNIWTSTEW